MVASAEQGGSVAGLASLLAIIAFSLFATWAWIPRGATPPSSQQVAQQCPRGIDLPGQLLAVVALTAFTAAVIEWRPLGLAHPLVAGGFMLALVAGAAFIAVEVDDAYEACAKIKAQGGTVVREAGTMKHGTTVIAFVTDPDGYKIEFIQRKK